MNQTIRTRGPRNSIHRSNQTHEIMLSSWPEDNQEEEKKNTETNIKYETCCTIIPKFRHLFQKYILNRLYYSYMNVILKKGAQLHQQRKQQEHDKQSGERNLNVILSSNRNPEKKVIHELAQDDLFTVPKDMQSMILLDQFRKYYQEESESHETNRMKKKRKTNSSRNKNKQDTDHSEQRSIFIHVLWKLAKPYFVPAGFYQLVTVLVQTLYPLIIKRILYLLSHSSTSSSSSSSMFLRQALPLAILLFVTTFIDGLAQERVKFLSFRSGITIRAATIAAIYQHALHLLPYSSSSSSCSSSSSARDTMENTTPRTTQHTITSGEITNFVAIDCQKLFEVTQEGHLIWSAPLSMIIVTALLVYTLGPATLVGMACMFLFVPFVQCVVTTMMKIRKQRMIQTDQRIHLTTLMLQSIRFCKLHYYESHFLQQIQDIREKEMTLVRKELAFFALTMFLTVITPVFACAVTFTAYVLIGGSRQNKTTVLTAEETFTTLIFFTALRFPINYAGKLMGKAAQGLQACQRLSHFFALETRIRRGDDSDNHCDSYIGDCQPPKPRQLVSVTTTSTTASERSWVASNSSSNNIISQETTVRDLVDDNDILVQVINGTFIVGNSSVSKEISCTRPEVNQNLDAEDSECGLTFVQQPTSFVLSGINLQVRRSETIAIIGPVGSGKSTLLNALLGDVMSVHADFRGSLHSEQDLLPHVSMRGKVAYASQTPFIINATLRENILFGSDYDEDLYERVLDSCNLLPDLKQLGSAGDLTEIGERGVTLSGGQKARVSLARCVYAQPDIALFDDILSALDAATGKAIFDRLFDSSGPSHGLLKKSAMILVTHSSHFLSRVDKILVLSRGESVFFGSWNDMLQFTPSDPIAKEAIKGIVSSLQEDKVDHDSDDRSGAKLQTSNELMNNAPDSGNLMTVEERDFGLSDWRTWLKWFRLAGGALFIFLTIVALACDRVFYVGTELWLSVWTSAAYQSIERFGHSFPPQTEGLSAQYRFLKVYLIVILLSFSGTLARAQWMIQGGARVSEKLIREMMIRLIHCPMSYFESTPMGRILNRLTYDVDILDITLSQGMTTLMTASGWFITGVILQISILPWVGFALAFVAVCYWLLVLYYRKSSVDLQRLDAVSRSPVQSHLSEALGGSAIIRAFGKENYFSKLFQTVLDINSAAMMNFMAAQRWSGSRIQSLGSLAILVAASLLVLLNDKLDIPTGIKAMLLIWSSHFTISLGFMVQALSESEASMTSVERIVEMAKLPQERDEKTAESIHLDSNWPTNGNLSFQNVSLRYRPGLPLALNGLSFELISGQRCGVVGRTGAGKSSISVALFRLTEIDSGTITLDGVDLSTIGLADVRGRANGLYIIPQDPVLYSGTLRQCLDPFHLSSDEDVLEALKAVRVGDAHIRGIETLRDIVEDGGSNYSLGEKQLLCLARAVLARPKVLILDEATASVDERTDALMQRMIRNQFPGTTLLTIAHRLNTIMDYDVVLVMDQGRAKEFGPPSELLKNESGLFSMLVDSTGKETSKVLRAIATQSKTHIQSDECEDL